MRDLRVSLPAPCRENWDAMAPRGCNRLCAACDTLVHDLSSLTVDEADAILDSGEPVCVRARIGRDGTIETAPPAERSSRRMVASVGAGVLLATAACQTTAFPPVSPRYQISGQSQFGGWATNAQLTSSDGRTRSMRIRGDRQFRFVNLRPGTYSLTLSNGCGEPTVVNNIVVSDDVDLGAVEDNDGDDCIIIGVMERANGVGDR